MRWFWEWRLRCLEDRLIDVALSSKFDEKSKAYADNIKLKMMKLWEKLGYYDPNHSGQNDEK